MIKVILLTTVFDHVMDGYAAYQFIHGTPYKRMFPEKLNETYANSTNCVLTSFRVDANETITGYQYDCTEQVWISDFCSQTDYFEAFRLGFEFPTFLTYLQVFYRSLFKFF